MQDLNDLYYFAMVVDHGGFAAAERAWLPSPLSRRISQLETESASASAALDSSLAVTMWQTCIAIRSHACRSPAAAREVFDRISSEPLAWCSSAFRAPPQQHRPQLLPDSSPLPAGRVQMH